MGAPSGFRRASSRCASSRTTRGGIACCSTSRRCTGARCARAGSTGRSGACASCAGVRRARGRCAGFRLLVGFLASLALGTLLRALLRRNAARAAGKAARAARCIRERWSAGRCDGEATGNHQHSCKLLFRLHCIILSNLLTKLSGGFRRPNLSRGASRMIEAPSWEGQSPKRLPSGIWAHAGSDFAMKPSISPSHVS